MEKICKAEGCTKKVKSRGVCSMHYARWASGNLEVIPDPSRHRFARDKCKVEGCERTQVVYKMCGAHGQQYRRNGKIEDRPVIKMVRGSKEFKFNHFVVKGEEGECWGWEGHRYSSGYGFIAYKGRNYSSHRFSYELHHGVELQPYEQIHHKCANKLCTNPEHLHHVSGRENMAEMFQRNYYIKELDRLRGLLEDAGIEY